ncbi:hypothetical protein ETH_00043655, partial [Eimeria tenella]
LFAFSVSPCDRLSFSLSKQANEGAAAAAAAASGDCPESSETEQQLQRLADSLALRQQQLEALVRSYLLSSFICEGLFSCRPLLSGSAATGVAVSNSDIDLGVLLPAALQQQQADWLLQQPKAVLKVQPWAV